MRAKMIRFMLRLECAGHKVDAYLAAQREDWDVYADAMKKASQAQFKITWGV